MKGIYQLREAAQTDLEEIWCYTVNNWHEKQADSYVSALLKRCTWLAENPESGRHRDDIKQGYYCFPEGSHLIFYRLAESEIDVIAFIHQKMDVEKYFDE